MSHVHCRCRVCGRRQTKPQAPDQYTTAPICRGCGRKWYRPKNLGKYVTCSLVPVLRVDKWAEARGWRKHTCYCDGYHHPHREGSRWCYKNEEYGLTRDEVNYGY